MSNFLTNKFIGLVHRGGADETTENTIPAFQYASDLGFKFIETDVQASKDGIIVIFHDNDLSRMSDRKEKISDLSFEEIKEVELKGGGKIPTLEETLITFPDLKFNIDVKTNDAVEGAAKVIGKFSKSENICLASFSSKRLNKLRNILGQDFASSSSQKEVVGLLLNSIGLNIISSIGKCVQVPPSQWGVPIITKRFIDSVHNMGKKVHVWTIDDKDQMDNLYRLGVDGIMTDKPTALKEFLIEKGLF